MSEADREAREAAKLKAFHEATNYADAVNIGYNAGYRIGYDAGHASSQDPLDLLLWCPRCFEQHVDEARPEICEDCGLDEDLCTASGGCSFNPWLNPPHKSHRCGSCNHVWRPSDRPTNGVQSLTSKGERDEFAKPAAFACGKDFDEAVKIATQHLGGQDWVAILGEDDLPNTARFVWVTVEGYGARPFVFKAHRDSAGLTLTGWLVKFVYGGDYISLYDGCTVTAWMEIASDPAPYQPHRQEGEQK